MADDSDFRLMIMKGAWEKMYNEALERARKLKEMYPQDAPGYEEVFPELRESEDERIKRMLNTITYKMSQHQPDIFTEEENEWFNAYLERLKEQKPAEWSKNDTVFLNEITDFFENKTVRLQHDIDMYAHWLKSLPERFVLRSKQEWSAEDEMETINVFRPLAGTSIESATKQAVNKFTNSGKKFLLAFNGVFILIDNTKSVQDIVSEYNRSLGGKKNEQGQSEGEPNDFEITLNDCMLAAQQYPPGKIGLDVVKMWAKELSNYCPQPNQKWSEFDRHCLERAIWYVENPAPNVIKDTNLVLWLKSLRPSWKPSEEQMEALEKVLNKCPYTLDTDKAKVLWGLFDQLKKLI